MAGYSDQYIEQTFYLWYESGRKISGKFANSLPKDENGNSPTFKAIEKWRDSRGWIERAEILDTELSQRLQEKMITERVEMYEKHVKLAGELIEKGKKFLLTHDLKDSSDAIKAIALGIDIEKVSIGQAEIGRRVLTMSNDQLERELQKMIGKPSKVSDEFIIDVESEDSDEEDIP